MVDGIKPHFDPSKPGARPLKIKLRSKMRPPSGGGGGGAETATGHQDRPYNGPSFGKNTYNSSDSNAGAANYAHSNNNGKGSRLGKNAPQAIDGLSDPGAEASVKGQPKMPSSSLGNAPTPTPSSGGGSPVQNTSPVQQPIPSSVGTPTQETPTPGASPATPDGNEGKGEAKKGNDENVPTDNAAKIASANKVARDRDDDSKKKNLPELDPTKEAQDRAIEAVLGTGTLGKIAKKVLESKIMRWLIITLGPTLGPWCCGACFFLTVVIFFVLYFMSEYPTLTKVALKFLQK